MGHTGILQVIKLLKRVLVQQGLKRIASGNEKRTKASRKERPEEAPLRMLLLLFFIAGTMSEKPVAALSKRITNYDFWGICVIFTKNLNF